MTPVSAWAAPALVAVAAIAAFLPALGNGFVNWDDAPNFLDNPHYRGLGPSQLAWMFTAAHMGHFIPLTWLTLGADYVVWGMRPFGYHLTSLLLHAGTAVAVYFLSLRLLRLARPPGSPAHPLDARVGAAAAALLFAVHPLRVESVVWVTERRDVLSGLFYVSAIIAYLKAAEGGDGLRRGWAGAALGLYAAALLSKSIAVTLPVALLLLDVYPLRRLGGARGWRRREVWLEKLPFLALGVAVAVVAFLAVMAAALLRPVGEMSLPVRLVLSVYGLAFYLVKSLVPLDLSPLYQLPITVTWFHFAGVLGGTLLAAVAWRRAPWLTAVWLFYVVTLLPVLGLFHNGPQTVADRYSYLACLGWAVLVGGLAARRWRGTGVLRVALAGWIVALGAMAWQQSLVWRDSVSLWSHAVAVNPASRAAHANLARAHTEAGHAAAAIAQWEETLRLSVHKATFLTRIGELHERAAVLPLALASYAEALRHSPGLPEACAGVRRLSGRGSAPVSLTSCPPASSPVLPSPHSEGRGAG